MPSDVSPLLVYTMAAIAVACVAYGLFLMRRSRGQPRLQSAPTSSDQSLPRAALDYSSWTMAPDAPYRYWFQWDVVGPYGVSSGGVGAAALYEPISSPLLLGQIADAVLADLERQGRGDDGLSVRILSWQRFEDPLPPTKLRDSLPSPSRLHVANVIGFPRSA